MKLAIILPPIYTMPPVSGGGIERLADTFCRLNETSAEPLEIVVFSRGNLENAPKSDYIHTKFTYINVTRSEPLSNRFAAKLRGDSSGTRFDYLRGLIDELKSADFDAILLEDCFEFAKYLSRFAKAIFLHAHHRFFDVEKAMCESGRSRRSARARFGSVTKFVFPSKFMCKMAIRLGVPQKKTVILHDCVDVAEFDARRFSEIREEKRSKYRLGENDILGVFVGRLTPERGAVELVKAVSETEYSASALKLLIVGSSEYGADIRDEYRDQLESAAPAVDFSDTSEQFSGKVIFIGSVKTTSTARFLSRADFAVVPSVADEPGGLPVLEAMACGLPLIVSDSGALAEYVGDFAQKGGCRIVPRGLGYTASLSKAIDELAAELHDSPKRKKELSEAARECALNFRAEKYYPEMRKILTDMEK